MPDPTETVVAHIADLLERYFPSPADGRARRLAAAAIVGSASPERQAPLNNGEVQRLRHGLGLCPWCGGPMPCPLDGTESHVSEG